MMGININCNERDFVALILAGEKTIETRTTPTLRPYVGKRVGLIRTQRGRPALLMGYASISEEIVSDVWGDEARISGTTHSLRKGPSYGYRLMDVEACEPTPVSSKGIVSRKI